MPFFDRHRASFQREGWWHQQLRIWTWSTQHQPLCRSSSANCTTWLHHLKKAQTLLHFLRRMREEPTSPHRHSPPSTGVSLRASWPAASLSGMAAVKLKTRRQYRECGENGRKAHKITPTSHSGSVHFTLFQEGNEHHKDTTHPAYRLFSLLHKHTGKRLLSTSHQTPQRTEENHMNNQGHGRIFHEHFFHHATYTLLIAPCIQHLHTTCMNSSCRVCVSTVFVYLLSISMLILLLHTVWVSVFIVCISLYLMPMPYF